MDLHAAAGKLRQDECADPRHEPAHQHALAAALPRLQQRVQDRLQALRDEGLPGGQAQVLVRDCSRHLHEEREEGGKERRALVFSTMLTLHSVFLNTAKMKLLSVVCGQDLSKIMT